MKNSKNIFEKKTDTSDFVVKRDTHAHAHKTAKNIFKFTESTLLKLPRKKANKCQLYLCLDETRKTDRPTEIKIDSV